MKVEGFTIFNMHRGSKMEFNETSLLSFRGFYTGSPIAIEAAARPTDDGDRSVVGECLVVVAAEVRVPRMDDLGIHGRAGDPPTRKHLEH